MKEVTLGGKYCFLVGDLVLLVSLLFFCLLFGSYRICLHNIEVFRLSALAPTGRL